MSNSSCKEGPHVGNNLMPDPDDITGQLECASLRQGPGRSRISPGELGPRGEDSGRAEHGPEDLIQSNRQMRMWGRQS